MTTQRIPSSARRDRFEELPLLRARLNRPNTGEGSLERPRLQQLLAQNADHPLSLLVADAGYGKTTLLASFVRRLARPVVWYSLMPSDADVVVFGRYLLEGFRRDAPRFGRDFKRALAEARPGARSSEMLAGTLANELAELRGPARLLVLDSFQEVAASRGVVAFTETLLRYLPASVRVIIASRSAIPIALERLRASGDVFEMHSTHLRFTRDEMGTLFREVYHRPLGESELTALEETVLGWPTAVHLVHESLRRDESASLEEVLADVRASRLQMHEYLSSEIYSRLAPAERRLLDRTAMVQRFDGALAAALAGSPPGESTLSGLVGRGLLQAFGHGAQVSYECHDLVRRFVVQELTARHGAEGVRALESETAGALEQRGESERALRHWLRAGREEEAVRLLRTLAPTLLRQGRAAALLGFLKGMPPDVVRGDPELALAMADTLQTLGDWDEAEPRYHEVLELSRGAALREIECRALLGLGKVLNLRGRHEQVLGMAERGLAAAHGLPADLNARLMQMKAGAHFYLGQYQAAVAVLGQVRSLLEASPDAELLVPMTHNLAGAYAAQGKFREASQEFRVALAQVRGTSSPRAPLYLSNLAFHLADLGELAEARKAAEEGLLAAQRFSNRAQECICHQALSQVLTQSGDLDGALSALKRAEDLNNELRMEVIEADLLVQHGRLFLARGQYRRAVEFVGRAIERLDQRPDDPRRVETQATLAWCELRAGRLQVARSLLEPLLAHSQAHENDYLRMRVHYWLGETLLALGEKRRVKEHLATALRLVRERGYLHFFKAQTREDHAPAVHALTLDLEPDLVAAALVEAGPDVEAPLLAALGMASTSTGETALSVLAEVGGQGAIAPITELARRGTALRPAARRALQHIEQRLARRGASPAAEADRPVRLLAYGPPRLAVGGQVLPASAWRTQRALHMLVYLALQPRGADRDMLLERFWPGRQTAAGRRNLHPTLSYVRKVLPRAQAAPILREAERYVLNPGYPMTCDAWDFDHALDEARRASDASARRLALERAVGLASGRFLEGLSSEWAEELQRRERDQMSRILVELGELCASAGDFARALTHFRGALEIDAYAESTCVAVMECHVRLGNRRAAMVEYEQLRTLLRREVGVDPLPETEEAVRSLLGGTAVNAWPDPQRAETAEPAAAQRVAAPAQVPLKPARRGSPR